MPKEYKIDRTTSELWIIDDSFVTRITEYVSLEGLGRYLYYDSSNAIDVTTDFRSRLTVNGCYDSSSSYFKATTIHFGDGELLVFGMAAADVAPSSTLKKRKWFIGKASASVDVLPHRDVEFNAPIRATRSMLSSTIRDDDDDDDGRMVGDYIFTRNRAPRKITPGPIGYTVAGYNLHIIGRPPTSYIVYDINGDETQEPMVKMNLYTAKK